MSEHDSRTAYRDDEFGPAMRGGPWQERDAGSPRPNEPGYGPAARGRRGRGGARRVARVVGTTLLVLLLVVLTTGVALAAYTAARIDREPVSGLGSAGNRMNVLVVGSDSREDLTREQRRELRTGSAEGARTDTIMLLSVAGGRAALLSFPRDLYVTRCDGTQGRINSAHAIDGPSCLVQTVSRLSGIPVTHYAQVEFGGFVDIVNAVGGVTLNVEEPIEDPLAGLDLAAGCQRLDGAQALGFVRTRAVDNDLGRIARQQRFLRELADEVVAVSTFLNVPRLFSVAGAAGAAVTTDEGLGMLDLLRLGRAGRGLGGGDLPSHVVPATPGTVGGAAVLVPDDAAAEGLFAQFRDGSVLGVDAQEASLTPGDVSLTVLNGAGVAGLAGEAAEILTERGFDVTDVGNADPVDRTVVRHAAGQGEAAELVAAQIPGAVTEAVDDDGPALALVLGPDARDALAAQDEAPDPGDAPVDLEPEPDPETGPPPEPQDIPDAQVPEDAVGAGTADC